MEVSYLVGSLHCGHGMSLLLLLFFSHAMHVTEGRSGEAHFKSAQLRDCQRLDKRRVVTYRSVAWLDCPKKETTCDIQTLLEAKDDN